MSRLGSRSPLDDVETLREVRKSREMLHFMHLEKKSCSRPVRVPAILPLPKITLDHCQDSCNKTVPIYWTGREMGNIRRTVYFIYRRWFRGHTTDLEFGRFVAKVISIDKLESQKVPPSIQEILEIHKAWCTRVDASMPIFQEPDILSLERMREVGVHGINTTQHAYYKLQPLFRSLILIIDKAVNVAEDQVVRLVSTDCTSGLSEPINFADLEGDNFGRTVEGDNCVVTTTLPKAIDFILKLEERERQAFPETRHPSILDKVLGDSETITTHARYAWGYTGGEICGPATSWAVERDGEAISLPKIAVILSMT